MPKKPGKRRVWPKRPKKKKISFGRMTDKEKRLVLRFVEHMRGRAAHEAERKRRRRTRKWPTKR